MPLFHHPHFPAPPSTDYRLTVQYQISAVDMPSDPTGGNSLEAIIELRIRQKYVLILEPIEGQRISLENDYVVSPEFHLRFKIPLLLLGANGPDSPLWRDRFVSAQLASLPINAGLAQFLKPHIQRRAVYLAHKAGHRREFKLVFHVMEFTIDLADVEECDRIRRSWVSLTPGGEESRRSEDSDEPTK